MKLLAKPILPKATILSHYKQMLTEAQQALDALDATPKPDRAALLGKAMECATFEGRYMGGYDPAKWPISRTEADALIQADPDYPETPWPNPPF